MEDKIFYLEVLMSKTSNVKKHLQDTIGDKWLDKVLSESNIINERDFDTCIDYLTGHFEGYLIGEFIKVKNTNEIGIIKDYKYIDNDKRVLYYYQNIQHAINMGKDVSGDDYSTFLTKKYIVEINDKEYEYHTNDIYSMLNINIIVDNNKPSLKLTNKEMTSLLKTLNKYSIPYKLF